MTDSVNVFVLNETLVSSYPKITNFTEYNIPVTGELWDIKKELLDLFSNRTRNERPDQKYKDHKYTGSS